LACRPRLLNRKSPDYDLEGFLRHFDFPNVEAAVKEEGGMTGMLCAVFSGDRNMLHLLVERRADANGKAFGLADLGYYDTQTLLMAAAKSCQEAKVLPTLMILRADPNLHSRAGLTPAWLAQSPEHVHTLLEHRADIVNVKIPPLLGAGGEHHPKQSRPSWKADVTPPPMPPMGSGSCMRCHCLDAQTQTLIKAYIYSSPFERMSTSLQTPKG